MTFQTSLFEPKKPLSRSTKAFLKKARFLPQYRSIHDRINLKVSFFGGCINVYYGYRLRTDCTDSMMTFKPHPIERRSFYPLDHHWRDLDKWISKGGINQHWMTYINGDRSESPRKDQRKKPKIYQYR